MPRLKPAPSVTTSAGGVITRQLRTMIEARGLSAKELGRE